MNQIWLNREMGSGEVKALVDIFQKMEGVANCGPLPSGWRATATGRKIYYVMKAVGFQQWGEVPDLERNKLRRLYLQIEAGAYQQAAGENKLGRLSQVEMAWLGDAWHKMDVRVICLLCGTTESERGRFEERYTSNEAQAIYWASLGAVNKWPAPSGTSSHSIGTAFEAAYMDEAFRIKYLLTVFGVTVRDGQYFMKTVVPEEPSAAKRLSRRTGSTLNFTT